MARKKSGGTTSADLLATLLKVPGIESVMIIGRDGFVIESLGDDRALVEMDALGASLATMVNSVDEMGEELEISTFADLNITYGRAVIVAVSLGDSVLVVLAPDAKTLGTVRYQCRKVLPELKEFF